MECVSIISADDGSCCTILVRDGADVVELAGKNNAWRTLLKAVMKMKILKLRKLFAIV
jgi:hypothetical protein